MNGKNDQWSAEDIVDVAKWQRYLLFLILIEIAAPIAFVIEMEPIFSKQAGVDFANFLGSIFGICVITFTVYFTNNLARSVREKAAPAYAILSLIPFVNILVLLLLNNMATGILRGNGIRVGMMGACPADLPAVDNAQASPPVDKMRVAAIVLVFGFLMFVVLMTMRFYSEDPGHPIHDSDTQSSAQNSSPAPVGTPAQSPTASHTIQAATPQQTTASSDRSLFVINDSVVIGKRELVRSNSPGTKYAVAFEDNGQSGFFYALDRTDSRSPVLDTLHLYDVSAIADHTNAFPLQIIWSRNGMQAAVVINRLTYAVFDFEARRGYCRDGKPDPNPRFTSYPHQWSDEALKFFK